MTARRRPEVDWFGDQPVIGTFHDILDPTIVEISALAGFDFCVIEWEHGLRNGETLQSQIRAADAAGIPALVRIGHLDRRLVEQVLDAGAAGLLIARVGSADEARLAVEWAKFPPDGKRGTGFRRGRLMSFDDPEQQFRLELNRGTALFAIIETVEGVEHAEEIIAVDGLTGILPGPADLGLDMGAFPPDDPRVQEALATVRALCAKRDDKCLLAACNTPEQGAAARAAGARAIMYGHDALLIGELYQRLHDGLRQAVRST